MQHIFVTFFLKIQQYAATGVNIKSGNPEFPKLNKIS